MEQAVQQTRPRRSTPQRVMLVIFVALLTLLYSSVHALETTRLHWDFETFYLIAQMVRSGSGRQLYDLSLQAAYYMRYIDPSHVIDSPYLPFFYPAGTVLLFLPLAWLPVTLAYSVWIVFNLTLLVMSIRILQRHLPMPQDDRPIFAAVLFMPLVTCLLQGQLSIVMLYLYTVAFSNFRRGNRFTAGLALGLGTLKFQLMLGFFAVLLLRRCWKALAGAAIGALPVALASAAILGWQGALHFPLTVTRFAVVRATPEKMITIYGVLMTAFGHQPPTWLLVILSVAVVSVAAFLRADEEVAFCAALLASILVAYHAFIYELALMLLPAAVVASRIKRMGVLVASVATAIVVPWPLLYRQSAPVAAAAIFAMIIFGLWRTRRKPVIDSAGVEASTRQALSTHY